MRKIAIVFLILLIGIAIVLLPIQGTQEEQQRPSYTVGVVRKAMDSEHWLAVRSSMQQAAQEHDIRLVVMTPENEAAYGEQNQMIEDLLQGGIDALIVSPVNIHHTDQWVAEAQADGIPLLTNDDKNPAIPNEQSDKTPKPQNPKPHKTPKNNPKTNTTPKTTTTPHHHHPTPRAAPAGPSTTRPTCADRHHHTRRH